MGCTAGPPQRPPKDAPLLIQASHPGSARRPVSMTAARWALLLRGGCLFPRKPPVLLAQVTEQPGSDCSGPSSPGSETRVTSVGLHMLRHGNRARLPRHKSEFAHQIRSWEVMHLVTDQLSPHSSAVPLQLQRKA